VHWARRAASRADWTAGSNSEIKTAMMAITTSSSIKVNAGRTEDDLDRDLMEQVLQEKMLRARKKTTAYRGAIRSRLRMRDRQQSLSAFF
jgi:hypothetical protein